MLCCLDKLGSPITILELFLMGEALSKLFDRVWIDRLGFEGPYSRFKEESLGLSELPSQLSLTLGIFSAWEKLSDSLTMSEANGFLEIKGWLYWSLIPFYLEFFKGVKVTCSLIETSEFSLMDSWTFNAAASAFSFSTYARRSLFFFSSCCKNTIPNRMM